MKQIKSQRDTNTWKLAVRESKVTVMETGSKAMGPRQENWQWSEVTVRKTGSSGKQNDRETISKWKEIDR